MTHIEQYQRHQYHSCMCIHSTALFCNLSTPSSPPPSYHQHLGRWEGLREGMRVRREREYKKGGKIKEEKRGERIKRCKEVELVSDVSRLRHILKIFAR